MRTIQVIIILLLTGCINAQDVEFSAACSPNVLRIGEQFNLTYSSNHELEEFDLPEIRDFELLGGPSQGHSQSVYAVNGKVTTTSTYQYTYFFRATKEGKFNIGPASVKIKNKVYRSNAVDIEVLKASSPNPSQNQSPANAGSGSSTNSKQTSVNEKDLFVRLVLDKRTAFLGEQIMATIKIYTKPQLAYIDQGFKGPEFTGFFTEPIETPPLRNLKREAVDGEIYYTGVIRRMVIIPQKTGELVIQPFDLDVAIRREVRRRFADPFFDDFSIPDVQEIPAKLRSSSVKINVKPLPANAPSSFKGGVGNFRINSSLNTTSTTTNEPLTLKVTISGTGNLKLINDVQVDVPYDMERYDPVINTKFDNALTGTKTFEYLIVPKVAGQFIIPPVEFTYFDANSGKYNTLKTGSFDVQVVQGHGDSIASLPGITKEDVKLLNEDIHFIKTRSTKLGKIDHFIAFTTWYYLLYILALLIFTGAFLLRKKMMKDRADVTGLRLRKADKYARKRLKKCEALLKQGNESAFFEEMLGALWGYISHKLNIPVSSLSKDSTESALISRGVEPELINQLFHITNQCEMARYAHNIEIIEKEQLYHEAIKVITTLQQRLK